jgi:hypothetical protein
MNTPQNVVPNENCTQFSGLSPPLLEELNSKKESRESSSKLTRNIDVCSSAVKEKVRLCCVHSTNPVFSWNY